jgi:hypothetical protein
MIQRLARLAHDRKLTAPANTGPSPEHRRADAVLNAG